MKNVLFILSLVFIFASCTKEHNDKVFIENVRQSDYSDYDLYKVLKPQLEWNINNAENHFDASDKDIRLCLTAMIIVESNRLKNCLTDYNNIIGMKQIHDNQSVQFASIEYKNGKREIVQRSFATFTSIDNCIGEWFVHIISDRDLNGKLKYKKLLKAKNAKEMANALYQTGYSKDTTYPTKLIAIIDNLKSKNCSE